MAALAFWLVQGFAAVGTAQSEEPDAVEGPPIIGTPPAPSERMVLPKPGDVVVQGRPVRLLFQSSTRGVSFHLKLGDSDERSSSARTILYGTGYQVYSAEEVDEGYAAICEAPCVATILAGKHKLALSLHGGDYVDVKRPVEIDTESVVHGTYIDRSRASRIGMWITIIGFATGAALMLASTDYIEFENTNQKMFWSGFGVFVLSAGVGMPFAVRKSQARVDVYPLRAEKP